MTVPIQLHQNARELLDLFTRVETGVTAYDKRKIVNLTRKRRVDLSSSRSHKRYYRRNTRGQPRQRRPVFIARKQVNKASQSHGKTRAGNTSSRYVATSKRANILPNTSETERKPELHKHDVTAEKLNNLAKTIEERRQLQNKLVHMDAYKRRINEMRNMVRTIDRMVFAAKKNNDKGHPSYLVSGLIRSIQSTSVQYDELQQNIATLEQKSSELTMKISKQHRINEKLFKSLKEKTGDTSLCTDSFRTSSLDESNKRLGELGCQINTLRHLYFVTYY
ncbi:hypothetical protein BDF22DRAFT_669788 [Syncephalis plumigaleata]|nr:hypothetical protein BDF22DRAFT_669788 [Syncephalis plumigaleata]